MRLIYKADQIQRDLILNGHFYYIRFIYLYDIRIKSADLYFCFGTAQQIYIIHIKI